MGAGRGVSRRARLFTCPCHGYGKYSSRSRGVDMWISVHLQRDGRESAAALGVGFGWHGPTLWKNRGETGAIGQQVGEA